MRSFYCWLLLLTMGVCTTRAQTATDTMSVEVVDVIPVASLTADSLRAIKLPGILVMDASFASLLRSALSIRTITDARISVWTGSTVAEMLSAESFAFISQNGATGSAGISLRGTGSDHAVITLDGVELTDPQTGRLDLSIIPVSFLESVTVSLGSAGNSGVRSALGGTVSLTSLVPTDQPSYRFGILAGAYGKRRLGGSASYRIGPVKALLAVDLSADEGDYPFSDPSSIFPREISRTGARKEMQNVYMRAISELAGGRWDASIWWSTTSRGVPGPANAVPTQARQDDNALRLRLGVKYPISGGSFKTTLAFSENRLSFTEGPVADPTSRNEMHSVTMLLTSRVTKAMGRRWMVGSQVDINHTSSGYTLSDQTSLRLDNRIDYESAKISFTSTVSIASWRSDEKTETHVLPRFALSVMPGASQNLAFRTSAGLIFRSPSFNDRYWIPGGNPNLIPESGWTVDAGVSFAQTTGSVSMILKGGLFGSRLSDKIIWYPGLAGSGIRVWTASNVGKVVGYGAESSIDLSWRATSRMSFESAVISTWTRAEDRTDERTRSFGHQLRYTPAQNTKARVRIVRGMSHVELMYEWVSKRYTTSDGGLPLDAYALLTIRVGHVLKTRAGNVMLGAALENATDAAIEHIRFYPMPPRHLTFSLKYELSGS